MERLLRRDGLYYYKSTYNTHTAKSFAILLGLVDEMKVRQEEAVSCLFLEDALSLCMRVDYHVQ